jgi:uncharacterized protein (TIGR02271 family)
MTGERSPYSGQQVVDVLDETYELHDTDGDKIGDIIEINPEFLVVRTGGGLFGGDERMYYVPRRAIAREDGDDWYLGIDKSELDNMAWDRPPTSSEWSLGQDRSAEQDWQAEQTSTETPPTATSSGDDRTGTRIRRYEEDLETRKTAQQAGEVTVSKDVVEEKRTIEVPVTREEVRVERRPVGGESTTDDSDAFSGETIRVPVMEEQVAVSKVARPVEEIEVEKVQTQDTERVEDTIRKERFDVSGDESRIDEQTRVDESRLREP